MTLIFDFNGTLLDDVDACYKILNKLLILRGHEQVTFDKYKRIFKFPIIEYYKDAGFIFPEDNYDELANIFVDLYKKEKLKLYDDVKETLISLKKKYKLVVLSSSEVKILNEQLKNLKIYDLFDEVIGNSDISGKSKIENGILYRKNHLDESITIIGDTDHDLEVSKAINANCILVSFGHQLREEKDIKIINSFKELNDLL